MSGDRVRVRLAAMTAGELAGRIELSGPSGVVLAGFCRRGWASLVPNDSPVGTMYLAPGVPAGERFGMVVREGDR